MFKILRFSLIVLGLTPVVQMTRGIIFYDFYAPLISDFDGEIRQHSRLRSRIF